MIVSGAVPAFFIERSAEIARPSSESSGYWYRSAPLKPVGPPYMPVAKPRESLLSPLVNAGRGEPQRRRRACRAVRPPRPPLLRRASDG